MAEALDLIASEDIGAVVQDMNYTQDKTLGEEGVELFRAIRALDPEMPVLMMTAWASLETAVALIKEGATDYMAKPWNDDKLVATVRNLVSWRAPKQENVRLQAQARRAPSAGGGTRPVQGDLRKRRDARGGAPGRDRGAFGCAGAHHGTEWIGQREIGRDRPGQFPAQGQALLSRNSSPRLKRPHGGSS
ncbi:MAG TPA: response regulator [Polyangia bacterium]|jgi:Response regulator containing CheY-like receiver, AAA-type ATPase, and DNA-binding domains|nr:response regulator [Polyangia bacterium]